MIRHTSVKAILCARTVHGHDGMGRAFVHLDLGVDTGLLQLLAVGNALVAENVELGNRDPRGRRLLEKLVGRKDGGVVPLGPVGWVRRVVLAEPEHLVGDERDRARVLRPGWVPFVADLGRVVRHGHDEELEDDRDAEINGLVRDYRRQVATTAQASVSGRTQQWKAGEADLDEPPTAIRDGLMPRTSGPLL